MYVLFGPESGRIFERFFGRIFLSIELPAWTTAEGAATRVGARGTSLLGTAARGTRRRTDSGCQNLFRKHLIGKGNIETLAVLIRKRSLKECV